MHFLDWFTIIASGISYNIFPSAGGKGGSAPAVCGIGGFAFVVCLSTGGACGSFSAGAGGGADFVNSGGFALEVVFPTASPPPLPLPIIF